MRDTSGLRDRPNLVFEAVFGFAWMFAASLLVLGGSAIVALAVGTHLLIRLRPDVTRVITYDPSTVATFAFIPVLAGLLLGGLYVMRLRRRPSGVA